MSTDFEPHVNYKSTSPLGLYIHWPFCIKKCYYCDLNSHVRDYSDYANFAAGLEKELRKRLEKLKSSYIQTVFFGGGTPSLMESEWIANLIQIVTKWNKEIGYNKDIEITIEANPTFTECRDLLRFHEAGVNRISFGVQTFNDEHLTKLGRTHTGEQARTIVCEAQKIFEKVSIDLMFNLPNQTVDEIEYDLNSAIDLQVKHVSYYALTIHDNTNFGSLYRENKLPLPDEDIFCKSYELIVRKLKDYGMNHYEISNFSFPDHESQHNLIYWKYRPFLGIGPGAHSRLWEEGSVLAVANYKIPEKWLESIENDTQSYDIEYLNPEVQRQEELLMKFRLKQGLNVEEIRKLLPERAWDRAKDLANLGDMWYSESGFGLNSSGFVKYNAILRYLN